MSALAEALLAAQRQAIGAATKAYVAGAIESHDDVVTLLDSIGAIDKIEQGHFLAALEVLRQLGAAAPATNGAATTTPKEDRPASEAQWKLIRRLADERGQVAPDGPLTVDEASRAIEQLKAPA